jgi:hypothetical protein
LFSHSYSYNKSWFRIWNPATGTISHKLGCDDDLGLHFNFTFGYDNSKDTFKVVRFIPKTTEVRVRSLNDNVWRNIQNSPVAYYHCVKSEVVHFSDSVNWLVISSADFYDYCDNFGYYDYCDNIGYYDYCENLSIEQFVIVSLDLRTETHAKLLLPQGFNEVPFVMPNLSVLNDYLCFYHDFKRTHFIIWQMRKFGVEDSWTQFLKISYHNLQINVYWYLSLFPLCLSEKNDTLLLINNSESEAILYNWRENRARRIDQPLQLKYGMDYVESLVSHC